MRSERELFKQAYLNLMKGDSLPFPDSVFDEYLRLRTENGYVVVPKEPTINQVKAMTDYVLGEDAQGLEVGLLCNEAKDIYKAMISAGETK